MHLLLRSPSYVPPGSFYWYLKLVLIIEVNLGGLCAFCKQLKCAPGYVCRKFALDDDVVDGRTTLVLGGNINSICEGSCRYPLSPTLDRWLAL